MISFPSHSRQACLLLTWLLDWFRGALKSLKTLYRNWKIHNRGQILYLQVSACMNTHMNFQTELIFVYFQFGNLMLSTQSQYQWRKAKALAAWDALGPLCRAINSRFRTSIFCCLVSFFFFSFAHGPQVVLNKELLSYMPVKFLTHFLMTSVTMVTIITVSLYLSFLMSVGVGSCCWQIQFYALSHLSWKPKFYEC